MANLEVKCPLCKGTLWIDQSTGKVIDHKSAEQQKVGFDDFLKQQPNKASALEEKARKARTDAERRKAEIEAQFKNAKEHPEELKGDVENPFKWE